MLLEHGKGPRRVRQDRDRLGAAYVDRVVVAAQLEDLRDPVAHGDEVDDLARVGTSHQGLQTVLVGTPGRDEPPKGGLESSRLGSPGVGLDDPCLHQPGERRPGQGVDVGSRCGIHEPGLLLGEAGGMHHARHLSGLPHPALALTEQRPHQGVPVLQVDGVPEQGAGGDEADAHHEPELGARELRDLRGAVATWMRGPLAAGQRRSLRVTDRLRVVEHRPLRGQGELSPLLLAQVLLVAQDGRARRVGVEVSDPGGVEHVFDSTQ